MAAARRRHPEIFPARPGSPHPSRSETTMRKFLAIAFACAALAACNTTGLAPLAGSAAGALALPACAQLSKSAAAATKCLNAAQAAITFGEALAVGTP
jgi:hypothetical protein